MEFVRDPMSWVAPTDAFLRINPIQRVPALVDESADLALLDSRLIAAYLYQQQQRDQQQAGRAGRAGHGGAGAPPLQQTLFHPEHRWEDENTLLMIDAALDSAINVFLLELDGVPRSASPYLARQGERVGRCLGWLDGRYAGRTSLHPGVLSFTDITLCCALDWLRFRQRHDVTSYANLCAVVDGLRERPSLLETHPSRAASTALPRVGR